MARINLMPWREKRRKERQKAFVALLGLAAAIAVGLIVVAWIVRAGQIDAQESRNAKLTKEIGLMKDKVEQIQDLDIKRDRLLGRKQVIEDLQSNRSHMVHLFDQIVRTLPDGIQLVGIVQKGTALTLEGRAESNARVSEYLNRLEASPWLEKADLKIIEEQKGTTGSKAKGGDADLLPYFFRLEVNQVNPNAPVLDANGNPVDPSTQPDHPSAPPVGQDTPAGTNSNPATPAPGEPAAPAATPGAVPLKQLPADAPPPAATVLPPAPAPGLHVPGKSALDRAKAYAADAPKRSRAQEQTMIDADALPPSPAHQEH